MNLETILAVAILAPIAGTVAALVCISIKSDQVKSGIVTDIHSGRGGLSVEVVGPDKSGKLRRRYIRVDGFTWRNITKGQKWTEKHGFEKCI